MSVSVMTTCWKFSKARGTDLLVLLALADNANDDGECWPSIPHLARKCRLDRRTTQRRIRSLEELGEVVVVICGGKTSKTGGVRSNHYRIVIYIPAEDADGGDSPPRRSATGGTHAAQTLAPVPPMTLAPVPPEPSVEPSVNRHSRGERRTRLPELFVVTDEMRTWATEQPHLLGVDLDAETEHFCDHHRAKGSVFTDWQAAWRSWMRRRQQFGPHQQNGQSKSMQNIDRVLGGLR